MALSPKFGISLCSGVGGLDLGLRIARPEYRCICYIENEAYAASVLVARMADKTLDEAPVWSDLRTFDGKPWCGMVDIITCGFPCQPWSTAGKQRGVDDDRWLWPHIARIIRECEPTEVLLENVEGILRGGVQVIVPELAEMGYDAAWGRFSARGVGAPHRRNRIFILARMADGGSGGRLKGERDIRGREQDAVRQGEGLADADGAGRGREDAYLRQRRPRQENALSAGQGEGVANTEDAEQQTPSEAWQRRAGPPDGSIRMENTALWSGQRRQGNTGVLGASVGEGIQGLASGTGEDAMGDADLAGLEGWSGPVGESIYEQFAWPPGPSDRCGWERLLAIDPSLEPAICGTSDGLTDRVERLRACGNAVVPLVAATAYKHLKEALQ